MQKTQTDQREPRPGALRYTVFETGQVIVAEPCDTLYSTITMVATEFWDSKLKRWVPIWDDPLS